MVAIASDVIGSFVEPGMVIVGTCGLAVIFSVEPEVSASLVCPVVSGAKVIVGTWGFAVLSSVVVTIS